LENRATSRYPAIIEREKLSGGGTMNSTRIILLSAALVLAGCVPQQQYNQEVQQVQQLKYLNATDQQLNQSLEAEVNANQVRIRQLQNRLEVTMVNDILFPEGGWELSE
jgi:chemotaxis protein MotB